MNVYGFYNGVCVCVFLFCACVICTQFIVEKMIGFSILRVQHEVTMVSVRTKQKIPCVLLNQSEKNKNVYKFKFKWV